MCASSILRRVCVNTNNIQRDWVRQRSRVPHLYVHLKKNTMKAQAKCTHPAVHTSSSPHSEIICQVISWLRLSAGHYIFVRKLFFSQLCAESLCTCVIDNKGMSSGPAQGQVFTQGRKSDVISPCIVCFQHTNSEHCFHFHLMDAVSLFSGELVHGFGSWRTYRANNCLSVCNTFWAENCSLA